MGAPSISIAFIERAKETMRRGERGILAMILKDAAEANYVVTSVADIPVSLSTQNKAYIKTALLGYETTPKKIIVYVIETPGENETLSYDDALEFLSKYRWDWLCIPTVATDGMASTVATWIVNQRSTMHATYKAVLPDTAADNEGIVNVGNSYKEGSTSYTKEEACVRAAGIICGTSKSRSCTYATIPEATDCDRMTQTEIDTAVDAGKFIFFWDGEKVKVCRGVTSFVTPTTDKGDSFKKIRLVEFMDMIKDDIRLTAQDSYIGKYPNTYDSKCVLITAINQYFSELKSEDVLSAGNCEIDIEKNIQYITQHGGTIVLDNGEVVSLADATEQQIKEAQTGSFVYLRATIQLIDAIEDIVLDIYIG